MTIRCALARHPRMQPLVAGEIDTGELRFEWMNPPGEGFKGVSSTTYDLYEYSFSGYLLSVAAVGQESRDWVALPVFISRCYDVLNRFVAGSSLQGWSDLGGKRVIAPDVGMTAAIWMRIMLRELYGLNEDSLTWVNSRQAEERHTTELGFEYRPTGLSVEQMPRGDDPMRHLEEGTVDAALIMERSAGGLPEGVRPLADAIELRDIFNEFSMRSGTTPVNHVLIARRSLLEENKALAAQIYELVNQSKQLAYEHARRQFESLLYFPDAVVAEQASRYGEDPYPSGVVANSRMVQLLVGQLLREGQLKAPLSMEQIFETSLLST